MNKKDYYEVLGVSKTATDEEIKRYRNVPLTLSLKGNILIEKFDNIDMIRDLSTGMKLVRIVRKYDERRKRSVY